MTWKKRRKNPPTSPRPHPPTPKAPATPSDIPPVVRSLMQEAADRAKTELTTTGRITPKALFLYDEESGSTIVTVTLSARSEQHREAVRKRVREKAAAEGARAVVIVHDVTAKHLTIFGVMDESRATASIDYVFNTPKKTVDRWDIEWQPVENDT